MYTRPSSPRSIGGVLDDAVRLYRESFLQALPLSTAASVAVSLPSLLLSSVPLRLGARGFEEMLETMQSPRIWLIYVICMLAYAVLYAALLVAINEVAAGRRADLPAALGIGLARLPRLVGAFIAVGLLVGLGLILLVVPGIYLWGALQLTFFPLILDDERVGASIGISRRLVKGHWWRAATVISVVIIMTVVLESIMTFLAGILIGIFGWQALGGVAILPVLNIVASALFLGLPLAGGLALYHDLKLRSEGDDLAARIAALAAR